MIKIEDIDWEKVNGLIPVVVQDVESKLVLMLGYMNHVALTQSIETKKATFYSRTKKRLWIKGETSGNFLKIVSMDLDCDQDTLLIYVKPTGNVCHKNTFTCFNKNKIPSQDMLSNLEVLIEDRKVNQPSNSYTVELLNSGIKRMAQKVGEEGVEVALAAMAEDEAEICNEAADLIFHLLVLLNSSGVRWHAILAVLESRYNFKQK